MRSSRRHQLILLISFASLLALGGVHERLRYWYLAVAAVIAFVAAMRECGMIHRRQKVQQQRLNDSTRTTLPSTAAETHSMYVIMQRFPEADLPTTSWSMRFSNLHSIAQLLDQHEPETVVEFGSGISTICIASWLKQRGRGRVISFDHDGAWAEITRQHLEKHCLDNFVHIVTAPLAPRQTRNGELVQWYSNVVDETIESLRIDFVIVDGPPAGETRRSYDRVCAAEVIAPHLSPGAIICLDDANRPGEQRIVGEWAAQLPDTSVFRWPSATGLAVVSCSSATTAKNEQLIPIV